jgi:hypothetical protein
MQEMQDAPLSNNLLKHEKTESSGGAHLTHVSLLLYRAQCPCPCSCPSLSEKLVARFTLVASAGAAGSQELSPVVSNRLQQRRLLDTMNGPGSSPMGSMPSPAMMRRKFHGSLAKQGSGSKLEAFGMSTRNLAALAENLTDLNRCTVRAHARVQLDT